MKTITTHKIAMQANNVLKSSALRSHNTGSYPKREKVQTCSPKISL